MIENAVQKILSEMDRKKLFAKKAHRDEVEAILRSALGKLLKDAVLPEVFFKKKEVCAGNPLPTPPAVTPQPPLDPRRPQAG